jgi:hypothetical protein
LNLYRRRLAREFQHLSPDFKDVNLLDVPNGQLLDIAEARIFADAVAASQEQNFDGSHEPREIKTKDSAGREISTFVGGTPHSWLNPHHTIRTAVADYSRKGSL